MPRAAFTLDSLAQRFASMQSLRPASIGIGAADAQAAAIARALEFGSVPGRQPWPHPGPRTVLAVDPETGASLVASAQAPAGFIRVQARGAIEHLVRELTEQIEWLDGDEIESHLSASVARTAQSTLARIRAAVPRDSGQLAAALQLVTAEPNPATPGSHGQ